MSPKCFGRHIVFASFAVRLSVRSQPACPAFVEQKPQSQYQPKFTGVINTNFLLNISALTVVCSKTIQKSIQVISTLMVSFFSCHLAYFVCPMWKHYEVKLCNKTGNFKEEKYRKKRTSKERQDKNNKIQMLQARFEWACWWTVV